MAILNSHKGSWFGLPDFGITEKLTGNRTAQGGSNLIGGQQAAPSYVPSVNQSTQGGVSSQPVGGGSVLGTRSTGVSGGATSNYSAPGNQILQNDVNRSVEDLGSVIDRDYETTMGALSGQESTLRGEAATAEQEIQAGYAPAKTALADEQAVREQGLAAEQTTANRQATSATQQARDLFRQTQQQNIAQLSGMGISSSSVTEALAEKLGVETARRLAGISGSLNEVVQNIAQETTRVKTFYKQKATELEQTMAANIARVQQSLLQGINQINSARQQAASDKANRRAELISNAQSQIAQLQAKQQEFQYSLQEWATKKSAALNEAKNFVISPTDFTGLTNAINNVNSLPQAGGFQPVPQIDYNQSAGGYFVTPSYQQRPKSSEDDLLSKYGISG